MPTTYAHWRFGDKCIKTLSEDLQNIINNNREIFDFGVHGPDIFFYYNCIKKNDINKFGSNMHGVPFEETLEKMRPLYQKSNNKESLLSYLLGFLTHFTLDSYCHGFVELKAMKQNVGHLKIESQADRYFLIKDGYNPVKQSATFSLKPNKKIASDIAELFPELNSEIVYKSLTDQVFYLNLIKDSNAIKRYFLNKLMIMANADNFKQLLITDVDEPICKDSNDRINKYMKVAVKHYPKLAKSLLAFLNDNKKLDKYFKNNFNHKDDYMKIPLLSYEEELKYEIKDFQK